MTFRRQVEEVVGEMSIGDVVTKFLLDEKYIGPGEALDGADSLLERGVIDSMGVLKLVAFLEETYGIEIEEDDLMPENFDSLIAISNYVGRKIA